jgi:hydrophobe/amphiphile efflux-3 (HAE3) family protein
VKQFWSNLAVTLGKRAGVVSLVGLLLTMVLGFGLTRLDFATGQDSYLNADDQVTIDNEAYQSLFGGQIMLTLFTLDEGTEIADITTGENAETIRAVTEELEARDDIKAVVTPLTALEFSNNLVRRSWDDPTNPEPAASPLDSIAGTILDDAINREDSEEALAARTEDRNRTACRLLGFRLDDGECDEPGFATEPGSIEVDPDLATLDNPDWVNFLLFDNSGEIRRSLQSLFPDTGHAQMIVRLQGNADLETEGAAAVAIQEAWAAQDIDGAELTVTGSPALLKDINDYLRGGLLQLGGLALVIMALLLVLLFDVRWRLLPLGVIILASLWTFGLAGYLGVPLSVVTIAGLPVLLGMGIDYAIQVHARVEEEVIIDRADHPIQETSRNLGPPLVIVTMAGVIAFLSLQFAQVPMIREFGILLAMGIVVVLISSIVIPMAALGAREYKTRTARNDYRAGALGRTVVKLGSLPPKVALPLIIVSGLILVGGVAVEGELELQTDPVEWVDQQSQTRQDIATLEREVDSASELGIYVVAEDEDALFSDETTQFAHDFTERQLGEHPDQLLRASSILTPISYLTSLDGASDLAPTAEQMRTVYAAAPDAIREFTVNEEGENPAMNILFTTRPASLSDRSLMVNQIRNTVETPGDIRATPSGLAVVGTGLLDNLEANRAQLTYLAIGFIFVFLTLRLKSPVRSTLCLVPVLIAVGVSSLAAFALGLKLSPMTAIGGPIVIAVCTEFTTLILLRFVEERRRGFAPQGAADVAASRTGRAFVLSALTGVVGVGVIATSSLPILRDFGIVVGLNVSVALLSALVVLPPMLVWADERRWVSRGLVPDEVLDRADKTADEPTDTPDLAGSPSPAVD